MTEWAKELFLKYNGNRFHMDREGEGGEYESYHISRETEEMWTEELISSFLTSDMCGKEAFRTYAAMTELLKTDRQNENWDTILYYPLRTECLDDVTILYMLPDSFRMAEKAVNKNCFSKVEADAYLHELERYTRLVRDPRVRLCHAGIFRSRIYCGLSEQSEKEMDRTVSLNEPFIGVGND